MNIRSKQNFVHIWVIVSYFALCQFLIDEIPTLLAHNLKLYITLSSIKVSLYFVYLSLVFSYIKKENQSTPVFSAQKNPNYLWLMVLLGSFVFLWLMEFLILMVALYGIVGVMFKFIVIISILVPFIFINSILIMALKKPLIFYIQNNSNSWSMNEEDSNKYLKGFIHLMEKENIYKDSELTLNKVSGILKINPKYLSLLLNNHLHTTFPDIVNKYRIESCKTLFDKGYDMTIQQIMYEVGYNSKSAFNKHFKRFTGCTPSEYKAKFSK